MADFPEPNTCPDCNGAVDPDVVCPTCLGQGTTPVRGVRQILKQIIAEQASQREDLTTALSAIWDKVKNL